MPSLLRFGPGATQDSVDPGRRLYRLFLLSILFGVLWVKGYLWSVFIVALLMYLFDAIILTVMASQTIEIPEVEPAPRRGRRRWQWNPDDPS